MAGENYCCSMGWISLLLTELDTVENYIYSLTNRTLSDFPGAVIAVFAYQYRVGSRSPDQVHGDMAFSRTGVSRVGTAPANYDAARRGFWVEPTDANDNIAVMPARYGAFLAMERSPSSEDAVLDLESIDVLILGAGSAGTAAAIQCRQGELLAWQGCPH